MKENSEAIMGLSQTFSQVISLIGHVMCRPCRARGISPFLLDAEQCVDLQYRKKEEMIKRRH